MSEALQAFLAADALSGGKLVKSMSEQDGIGIAVLTDAGQAKALEMGLLPQEIKWDTEVSA